MFNDLVKFMSKDLNTHIMVEEKGGNKFLIYDHDSNIDEEEFTQIKFRFENNTLIIPGFFLKKQNVGIGSKIMKWFIKFCKESNIFSIEIRTVGRDKQGMLRLLNKFDFKKVKSEEYMDFKREL
jgi:hypothetical protein